MCIFAMKIPAMTKPYNVILLMNCVFLLPITIALIKALSYSERRSAKKIILFGLAFVLELAGCGLTGYMWSSIDLVDIWYPLCGVICLSVAWLPEIQSYLLKTNERDESEQPRRRRHRQYSYSAETNEAIERQQQTELADMSLTVDHREEVVEKPQIIAQNKPTWKMVIFMSFWKIIFTFVFSLVLLRYSIFSASESSWDIASHFRTGWSDWGGETTYFFIANCCSSLLGYTVGFIACTTCMQRGSYVLPLFLATPLAAVLLAVKKSCTALVFADVTDTECDLFETLDVVLFCVAVACLVLAHFLSFGILIVTRPLLVKQSETQVT